MVGLMTTVIHDLAGPSPQDVGFDADRGPTTSNLTYRGGVIMHAVKVHAIYWLPPGAHFEAIAQEDGVSSADVRYMHLIDNFFQGIDQTSLFQVMKEYTDSNGTPQSVSVAESILYQKPLPHAGTQADPLTNSDILGAIGDAAPSSNSASTDDIYFVFTSAGVQECNGSDCTFAQPTKPDSTQFGGYHSSIGSLVYSFIGDAATIGADRGNHPNDPSADATVDTVSHELFEAMLSPTGQGWLGPNDGADETGDKCNYNYGFGTAAAPVGDGAVIANTSYRDYDNHPTLTYSLQQEWSNEAGGCVLSKPAITHVTPSSGPVEGGGTITVQGAGFVPNGTSITIGWVPATNVSCTTTTCTATVPPLGGEPVSWPDTGYLEVHVLAAVGGFTSGVTQNTVFDYLKPSKVSCFDWHTCPNSYGPRVIHAWCDQPVNWYLYDSYGHYMGHWPDDVSAAAQSMTMSTDTYPDWFLVGCPPGTDMNWWSDSCAQFSRYEPQSDWCGPVTHGNDCPAGKHWCGDDEGCQKICS